MKRIVLVVLIGLTLAGLVSTGTGTARRATQEPVPTGMWDLQAIAYPDGHKAYPGKVFPYNIEFYPGEVSVVSGLKFPDAVVVDVGPGPDGRIGFGTDCTEGSADYYIVEGTQLFIDRLVTSRGGCMHPLPRDEEFEDLLLAVTGYALDGDRLVLFVSGGAQLHFVATRATPVAG